MDKDGVADDGDVKVRDNKADEFAVVYSVIEMSQV